MYFWLRNAGKTHICLLINTCLTVLHYESDSSWKQEILVAYCWFIPSYCYLFCFLTFYICIYLFVMCNTNLKCLSMADTILPSLFRVVYMHIHPICIWCGELSKWGSGDLTQFCRGNFLQVHTCSLCFMSI